MMRNDKAMTITENVGQAHTPELKQPLNLQSLGWSYLTLMKRFISAPLLTLPAPPEIKMINCPAWEQAKKTGSLTPFTCTELENKEQISEMKQSDVHEVMPDIYGGCNAIEKLTWHLFDDEYKCLEKQYTFFGFPSSEKEIYALVNNAAPLNRIEACIRTAYDRGENHLFDTLVIAREASILNLDVNFTLANGKVIPGMAETITRLGNELYGEKFQKRSMDVMPAFLMETEKQKQDREDLNIAAVNQVFDAISKNDQNTPKAIEIFQAFANSNKNPLNRLHLLSILFGVFSIKGGTFIPGKWYGKLAELFYFKVIGATERGATPRLRQIIDAGIHTVLKCGKDVERNIDIGGKVFISPFVGTRLGVDFYYDAFDFSNKLPQLGFGSAYAQEASTCFNTYYEQLYQHLNLNFYPNQLRSNKHCSAP